jgi:hypothetical protein
MFSFLQQNFPHPPIQTCSGIRTRAATGFRYPCYCRHKANPLRISTSVSRNRSPRGTLNPNMNPILNPSLCLDHQRIPLDILFHPHYSFPWCRHLIPSPFFLPMMPPASLTRLPPSSFRAMSKPRCGVSNLQPFAHREYVSPLGSSAKQTILVDWLQILVTEYVPTISPNRLFWSTFFASGIIYFFQIKKFVSLTNYCIVIFLLFIL